MGRGGRHARSAWLPDFKEVLSVPLTPDHSAASTREQEMDGGGGKGAVVPAFLTGYQRLVQGCFPCPRLEEGKSERGHPQARAPWGVS